MNETINLDGLRKHINALDEQLLKTLSERQTLSKKIGAWKKDNGMQVFDPKREQSHLQNLISKANDLHLDPVLIEKLYALIFEFSKKVQ